MNIIMLEDFVEANSVPAQIVHKRLSENLVKCVLLVPREKRELPLLVVFPAGSRISLEKAMEKAECSELRPAGEKETLKITGYEHNFLPPISIYGVRVLVEESILNKSFVNVIVGEEKTLRIDPRAIIEFNEEAIVCKLVRAVEA